MKRWQRDAQEENYRPEKANLLSKDAFDAINWYDYVEFLSKIYELNGLSIKDKLESLCETLLTFVDITKTPTNIAHG